MGKTKKENKEIFEDSIMKIEVNKLELITKKDLQFSIVLKI